MKKSRTSAPKPIWYALFIVILTPVLQANDWPKWLGPNENNQVAAADNFDPNLENWKIAWQKNVGLGYSSTTTFQGKVYTMGHDGKSKETISALDHGTGDELWSYIYEGDLIP